MAKERCVVVGAGGISNAWFKPLVEEKLDVAAVVDLDLSRAQGQIDTYGFDAEASTDLRGALQRCQPDFVIDLTVPEAHCKVTCTALAAGCHVIGEKPMANSMAEARKMVKAANESGKLYMVSQSRRWIGQHDQTRRMAAASKIGPVALVNCDFYLANHFKGFRAEMPSPLVLDMAIHHFDLCRFFTGLDPVAVYAREFNPGNSWSKGDCAASCIFEMTGGILFSYNGSWCTEGHQTSWNGTWRIAGEKGTVLLADDQAPVTEVVKGKIAGSCAELKQLKPVRPQVKHLTMHGALREMLGFLRTGKMPQTPCQDNIKSLAMVFGAIESSRKGRRIKIND